MDFDAKKDEILKTLDYWHMLDFASQESEPEEYAYPKVCRKRSKGDENESLSSVFDQFKVNLAKCSPEATVEGVVKERLRDKLGLGEGEVESLFFSETLVYLYSVDQEIVSNIIAPDLNQVDKDTKRLSLGVLRFDSEWQYCGFELSPAIWIAKNSKIPDARGEDGQEAETYDSYVSDNDKIENNIGQLLNTGGFSACGAIQSPTCSAIQKAVNDNLEPYLDVFRKDGKPISGVDFDVALVDYAAYADKDRAEQLKRESRIQGSFFAKDLERLRSAVNKVGNEPDLGSSPLGLVFRFFEASMSDDASRFDILTNEKNQLLDFYRSVLDLDNTPVGRWPSKYPLALMQQVAVNLTAGRKRTGISFPSNDIMSVNGPPGTGKTTLLKDVIAANIVEKAVLLARFQRPDDAFEKVKSFADGKYLRTVWRFKDERVNDLGIIVCSSNNAAIDNISTVIPDGSQFIDGLSKEETAWLSENSSQDYVWVDKDSDNEDAWTASREVYFSYAADKQLAESDQFNPSDYLNNEHNPGLLTVARLGNSSNRKNFTKSLWLVIHSIKLNKGSNLDRYEKARTTFLSQYARVQCLMAERAQSAKDAACAARERECCDQRLPRLLEEMEGAQESLNNLEIELVTNIRQWAAESGEICNVLKYEDITQFEDGLTRDIAPYVSRKNYLARNIELAGEKKGLSRIAWIRSHRISKAEAELEEFVLSHPEASRREKLRETIRGARESAASQRSELKQEISCLLAEEDELRDRRCKSIRAFAEAEKSCADRVVEASYIAKISEGGREFDDNSIFTIAEDAQLYNPAKAIVGETYDLMRERNILFVRALQLTREFILASNRMKDNLLAFAYMLDNSQNYDSELRHAAMPVLFQALNVLTPVISSTFASAERLFGDVEIKCNGKAPFGLLVIDEAGQAVPFAAVGMLSRCRRALVVGDPGQIAPVVSPEAKAIRKVLGENVKGVFSGDSASVQRLADAANPYGHSRVDPDADGLGDKQWVGCPLVIHRRCISPMFDISNKVSYEGGMINKTRLLSKEEEEAKRFCKESSQWINVGGRESAEDRDHYVQAQGDAVAAIVETAFRNCRNGMPSLFVISPFTSVIAGVRDKLKSALSECAEESERNKFLKNNIGTVHTFQGKEADEVIFVLGCDKRASKAVRFVNANIVNVAASRAKYRLYIIGDYNVWKGNDYIKAAKRELDVAWVSHWKKSQEYKGEEARQELNRAIALLPQGASIPTLSNDGDDSASQSGQEVSEFAWDTTSYLNNVRDALGKACSFRNLLSNDDCKAFGFETLDDLELAFACCASGEGNLVLDNLEQGIFFYKLLDGASERFDRSSGLIMFCRAAELYLRELLLPRLQEIAPHESSGKRNNQGHVIELGKLDERQAGKFMLGAYKPIVEKSKVNLAKCYFAGAKTLNNEESGDRLSGGRLMCGGSGILEGKMNPAQAEWWGAFAGSLQGFSKKRNNVCHPGNSVQSTALLGFLFSSFWDNKQGTKVAIMEQSSVFEALKRGYSKIRAAIDATAESELLVNERDVLEGSGSSLNDGEFAKALEIENTGDELPRSLTGWDKKQGGALSELAKSIQLPGQWQTKLLDLLVMEGFLDDLGDRGRKATQKGQEFGITDKLFKEDGRPGKYNPEFSSEAIDYIKSNINDWTLQINKA